MNRMQMRVETRICNRVGWVQPTIIKDRRAVGCTHPSVPGMGIDLLFAM
jgi:hypothetical protein